MRRRTVWHNERDVSAASLHMIDGETWPCSTVLWYMGIVSRGRVARRGTSIQRFVMASRGPEELLRRPKAAVCSCGRWAEDPEKATETPMRVSGLQGWRQR